jgi:hypothetical protein
VPRSTGVHRAQRRLGIWPLCLKNEPVYPGDLGLERRIIAIVRWNALAMVVRANRESAELGGISRVTHLLLTYSKWDSTTFSAGTKQRTIPKELRT